MTALVLIQCNFVAVKYSQRLRMERYWKSVRSCITTGKGLSGFMKDIYDLLLRLCSYIAASAIDINSSMEYGLSGSLKAVPTLKKIL